MSCLKTLKNIENRLGDFRESITTVGMSNRVSLPNDLAACQELIRRQQRELEEHKRTANERLLVIEQAQRTVAEKQRVLDATADSHQQVIQELDRTRAELTELREDYRRLQKWVFGRRSERHKYAPGQMTLFDIDEPEAPEHDEPCELPTESTSRGRRRKSRQIRFEDLPHRRIPHDLTAEEKICSGCHREMQQIGTDETHIVQYRPAVMEVEVHVRPKYACSCCKQGVASPPAPVRPIHRSMAGPGLIAQVLVSKFFDHLPLYRLEDVFARHGLHLARSTLCGWVKGAAELLEPLHERLKSIVLDSPVLWTDDTPVRVLDQQSESGTHRGHFWTYIGDDQHPYSVFDFTENRSSIGPRQFLRDYTGFVHADAYSGYDAVFKDSLGQATEVACWAHTRRKFDVATQSQPREAHQILEWIRQLYDVEDRASDWTISDRHTLRLNESRPILDRIGEYLDQLRGAVLPKSALGEAITYTTNQWQALRRYTEDGRLTIDNNVSERTLRPTAIGRKNWLFLGNDEAGSRAAIVYSIVASAKRHQVEPWAYISDILLHLYDSDSQLDHLLPDQWLAAHPDCKLAYRVEQARSRKARKKSKRAERRSKSRTRH